MSNFKQLPVDIKFIILEFLSIDDCTNLQTVDRKLFNNFPNQSCFWAQKLFERYIQYQDKELNMLKFQDIGCPFYIPTPSEFKNFSDAKFLWEEMLSSQKKLSSYLFTLGVEAEEAQSFTKRIFTVVSDAPVPLPVMKRENQCLLTSSTFENFLTDRHFDVCSKRNSYDREFGLLKRACQTIEDRFTSMQMEEDSTRMSEIKRDLRNRKQKRAQRTRRQTMPKLTLNKQVKKSLKSRGNEEKRMIQEFDNIQEVFHSIQKLMRSHCKIIKNYLLSLSEDRIILKEYKRCWKEYTYSIIELNSLLQPYEKLINEMSSLMPKGSQTFSLWKGMVKPWIDEVYSKVALKVKTSFHDLLMEVLQNQVKKAMTGGLKTRNNSIETEEENEKTLKLLQKSFIALSDISLGKSDLNETKAVSSSRLQPKIKLLNFLYPNIKRVLETTAEKFEDDYKMNEVLKNTQAIFETVFNEEVCLEKVPESFSKTQSSSAPTATCCNKDEETVNYLGYIAGQYKIVSKCKWDYRLNRIYQEIQELNI